MVTVKPRRSRLNPAVQKKKVSPPTEVKVYDKEGNEISIKKRKSLKAKKHRGERFAETLNSRTDARRVYTKAFITKLIHNKNRTSDGSGMVVLHDTDRDEVYQFTTNPSKFSYNNQTSDVSLNSTSSTISSPPTPSFAELAHSSPSKTLHIDEDFNEETPGNICRICKVKFQSTLDITSDSPWMGCVYGGAKACTYWVHSVCKGFADADRR